MTCELTTSALHGYLDGELDAARAADFERHLVSCPDCERALEAQEKLRASLQRAALYERAPAALRRKIDIEVGGSVGVPSTTAARRQSWNWLAVAAAFLVIAVAGWRLRPFFSGDDGATVLASAIVDAHLRSLQPGHLEDVVSSDQHTVKPWFDGKLDFSPPVRNFAEKGYPLLGGRLDVIRGRSVAVLVYGRRKHVINVFIWPAKESGVQPASGSQLGYNWVDWSANGMELRAVSDLNTAELIELQQLLAD